MIKEILLYQIGVKIKSLILIKSKCFNGMFSSKRKINHYQSKVIHLKRKKKILIACLNI
jgi:hypothetical protein